MITMQKMEHRVRNSSRVIIDGSVLIISVNKNFYIDLYFGCKSKR